MALVKVSPRIEGDEHHFRSRGREAMGKLISVQPVLPTKDVVAGIAFYVKRLGFQVAFQ
ncbi:MAG: hypothetical protein ACJAVJ_001290, partial [Planctomycetota bacterium]